MGVDDGTAPPTGKATTALEHALIASHEVGEVRAQLVVVFVMEAFDGCLLDGAVHSFDLAIRPGVVRLGQSVLDPILLISTQKCPGFSIEI